MYSLKAWFINIFHIPSILFHCLLVTMKIQDELESSLRDLEEKHTASVKAIEDNAKAVSSFRAEAGSAETLLKSIEERIGENDALIAEFEKDYAECGEKYEEEKISHNFDLHEIIHPTELLVCINQKNAATSKLQI